MTKMTLRMERATAKSAQNNDRSPERPGRQTAAYKLQESGSGRFVLVPSSPAPDTADDGEIRLTAMEVLETAPSRQDQQACDPYNTADTANFQVWGKAKTR